MLETLDHTIRIGSTPTFLYFDLYLYNADIQKIYTKKGKLNSKLIITYCKGDKTCL